MVNVDKIIVDSELYPRDNWNFQTSYGYSQAMLAGAKFPSVVLALNNGKYYLVDGKHRIEAIKILKHKEVSAEVHVGWSRQQIFEEAVKRNVAHGKALTVHEKRVVALRLRKWNYDPKKISELVQVPLDKLDNFVAQRLVNAITGEVIAEGGRQVEQSRIVPTIVKSGIKNLTSENTVNLSTIQNVQPSIYSGSQASLLRQLIKIIKAGLLDTKNKDVNKLVKELKELL